MGGQIAQRRGHWASMVREGGFPVDDEDVLETLARMHRTAGEVEAAAILRSSRCRFMKTGHDSWDGGTDLYTLFIQVAAETFVSIGDRRPARRGRQAVPVGPS